MGLIRFDSVLLGLVLVGLILDGKTNGRIDQVNGVLIKEVESGKEGGGQSGGARL